MGRKNFLLLRSIMATLLIHGGLCQTCSPTWFMYNEECFKYFEESIFISSTKERCDLQGAEQISALTPRFKDVLLSHVEDQHNNYSYWCNTLTDPVPRTTVLPLANAGKAAGIVPTEGKKEEKCCYIQNKTVHEGPCEGLRGYICEKDSISPPATCPKGTKNIGSSCFWMIPVLLDRTQAEEVCVTRGGVLANLKSRKKKMYGIGVVALKNKDFWVGARKEGDKVKWNDGEFFYLEEDKSYISSRDDGGDCVRLGLSNASKRTTTWIIGDCNITAYGLCETAALITSTTTRITPSVTVRTTTAPKPSCPTSSKERQTDGVCYWETTFSIERYDWDTARQFCQSYGGDLASYKTEEEEEFAIGYAKGNQKGMWIGLKREPGSNVFRWSDGSTLTYTNWALGQPKTGGDSKLCVAHSGEDSKWEVFYCGFRRWFVCKIAKASVVLSPVVPTEEPLTQCSKPEINYERIWWLYQGYCYAFYQWSPLTWEGAKAFCQDHGAYLASVHSMEEANFLIRLSPSSSRYNDYWIGLRAKGLHSSYHWDDGTPVDFVNWDQDETYDDTSNIDTCISYDSLTGFWKKHRCDFLSHVICKSKNDGDYVFSATAPAPSLPGFCPDEWYTFGNKCYKIFGVKEKEIWPDAKRKCAEIGSTLASIHNKEELDFLSLLLQNVQSDTWIGMYSTIGGRLYHWTDNSTVDYTNWKMSEPNFSDDQEECVHMVYERGNLGKWNDHRCTMRFPYICQIPKDPMLSKPGNDAFLCKKPQGWLKLASSCYKIFNESEDNLTWLQAQTYCLSVAGNLASVMNFGVSMFLGHHLRGQERVFWIGMRGTKKYNYEWLGFSAVSYTDWLPGQPQDVSEMHNCVAVDSDGKWMVRDCDESHPFICEYGQGAPTVAPYEPDMMCPNSSQKWVDFGGKSCYIIETKTQVSWHDAVHRCFREGGHLASLHSIDEQTAILHHVKDSSMPVYIGFGQKEDGSFAWFDGSPVDYVNWAPEEPNDIEEMCVEMHTDVGTWNDVRCTEHRGFVCSTTKVPRKWHSTGALGNTEKAKDLQDRIAAGGIVGIVVCVLVVLAVAGVAAYYFCPSTRMRSRRFSEPASP